MGLVSRLRRSRAARAGRRVPEGDEAHLRAWAAANRGVEMFVEPRTTVTDTTAVMVAADGSWTRRRVGGPEGARRLARSLRIPVYDVQIVGYPQRMRDHDARERALRRRRLREDLDRP
ncbi:oxidoreductase [Pseudonocardia sp.]|jgi:hypothetical protein|uniref:oxidoreductase n=1 Tax=Pseudonocardia sp. TaxID=60912 RepID=UPI003D0A73D9